MKKVLIICLVCIFSVLLIAQEHPSHKRIHWGEDPVDIKYVGQPGYVTVKYLKNDVCITTGGSGKTTTGYSGKGNFMDIDSVVFYSGEKIYDVIMDVCKNPTVFPNGLDRTQIIICKRIIVGNTIEYVPDSLLNAIAGQLNLLQNEVGQLRKDFSLAQDVLVRVGEDVDLLRKSVENKTEEEGGDWGWIIPTSIAIVVVAVIAAIALHNDNGSVVNNYNSDGGNEGGPAGPPPNGKLSGVRIGAGISF